jgi:hypothetical protein
MYFAFVMEPNDRDLVLAILGSNYFFEKPIKVGSKNVFDLIFFEFVLQRTVYH